MAVVTILLVAVISIVFGFLSALGYMVWRMLRCDGWDRSNMTNALRLISHTVLHPDDFGKMYYLTDEHKKALEYSGFKPSQPFWYIDKDELSEVVGTRPES